ncbi:hypothetical protein [Thalassomonas sp. RHCl1]|uniref:hypothetical protein n=1 Tax=Thalassomonas sp. RHCl1 TaxID=2995320 RepID=UPI00248B3C49|nr:hypothetical protein [Thalassomonas sp. RHCl1]
MLRITLFLLAFVFTAFSSLAQKHIIAGAELTSLFEKNGVEDVDGSINHGVYYDIINLLLRATGLDKDYQLMVFPMARAKRGFVNEKFACYSPGIETFDNPQNELSGLRILSGEPINQAIVRVVSRFNEPLVDSVNDIDEKDALSLVRGVPISGKMEVMLNRAGKVYEVATEYENIMMLKLNRVSRIILFYPDAIDAYEKLNLKQHYPYQLAFTPLILNDNIICHQEHEQAFRLMEAELKTLKSSGKLKAMMGNKYMIGSEYVQLEPGQEY